MNGKTIVRRIAALGAPCVFLVMTGCGGTPSEILLAGKLTATGGGGLAGHKLKCVTLTDPSFSGTSVADGQGAFGLVFPGDEVPFGCFVLDGSDVQIASVIFTSTLDNLTGQTIQIEGGVDLSSVAVDISRGTATATVAAPSVTSVSELECPLGLWRGTVGENQDCGGDTVTADLWLGKDAEGNYVLGQALNPHKSGTCGISAFAPTDGEVTYADSTLEWTFEMGRTATAEAEVSAVCDRIGVIFTQTDCALCNPANLATLCQGSGANTCSSNVFYFNKR